MKSLIIFISQCTALSYAGNDTICTNGFQLVNNKCWKLFTDARNHTSAEKNCTSCGGTLFMTKNETDNKAVGSLFNDTGIDRIWIGLFCFGNDKSQCYCDDRSGSTVSYNNFAIGFPNTGTGKCVYYSVSGNGQWLNGDCKKSLSYVCELPPTHQDICDLNFNDNCYFFFDPLPFTQAQRQCEELCCSLVSIHSADENRYITSIYADSGYPWTLIGGIATSNDNLVWTDGSIMDYNNIETLSSGSCFFMSLLTNDAHSRGSWFTGDCSTGSHFVCKRPIGAPNCRGTPPPVTPAPPPITPPTCTTGVYIAPGAISSKGFPSPYLSTATCMYTLTTFGSNRIRLTINFLYIYISDYLYIYDGDSTDAPLIQAYTYVNPGSGLWTFTSSGNTMLVYFKVQSGNPSHWYGFNSTFYSIF